MNKQLEELTYLIRPVGPLSESLDDPYKFIGEPEISDGKPIDIGTRLQTKII